VSPRNVQKARVLATYEWPFDRTLHQREYKPTSLLLVFWATVT
jgi:hypothetical protein